MKWSSDLMNSRIKDIAITYGLGFTITLFMFFLMAKLVEPGKKTLEERKNENLMNFILQKDESKTRFKNREIKKIKPIEKPQTEKVKPTKIEQKEVKMDPVSLPKLSFKGSNSWSNGLFGGTHSSGPEGDADGVGMGNSDQISTPIVRIEPQYPREAAMKGAQGYVIAEFDITESGTVENIRIKEASPRRLFDNSVKSALRKWKYRPKIEDGKAIYQKNQQVKLEFKLEK